MYYHDTDAGGVVYYARYLEHLEEARTEFCRAREVDIAGLAAEGTMFTVVRLEVDYKAPARYGETVRIAVRVEKIGNASLSFIQEITRGDVTLLIARTVWACVNRDLKVRRIPEAMRSRLVSEE